MGQTLTHGVYLPDEGERNCYNGLAANWSILDGAVGTVADHTTALSGKAPLVHTHTKSDITDFPAYGTTAGTICEGNDSRLSDARTPVAHTHAKSDVTDLLNSDFIPSANNSYDLGSSSYQWNNVYSKGYYYNGTAWGLDKYNKWTGVNDFNNLIGLNSAELWFKQPNIEDITTNPNADTSKSVLQIYNKGTTQYFGGIADGLLTDGTHRLTISCFGFPLNNYAGYYPHSFSFDAKRDGTASFSPSYTNASLGTSTNKWASVYADSYYYGTTAWGLDQNNIWTGTNNFKNSAGITTPQNIDVTTNPSTEITGYGLGFWDNNRYWFDFHPQWATDGSFRFVTGISNWQAPSAQGWWALVSEVSKDFGTFNFWTTHGNANLGTSTYKWKTLNGVNPGALSLPSGNAENINTTNWDFSWSANIVTAPFDGYISIACFGSALQINNETKSYAMTFAPGSDGFICGLLPVNSSDSIKVLVTRTQTSIYEGYKFIKANGNVS